MADITEERINVQQEETATQAAVSEATMSRVGAAINFVNKRHFYNHDFNLNGKYNIVAPQNGHDGFLTYPFPFEILDVVLKTGDNTGGGGVSEFDLKWKPFNSGTYQSIFTTTPKYTNAAAAHAAINVGGVQAGMTAPVLLKTQFDAYDLIRLDTLQHVTGNVDSAFLKIFIRPR